ncbi:hypothetical protein MRX96_012390 [Rhipicephalus microplus]
MVLLELFINRESKASKICAPPLPFWHDKLVLVAQHCLKNLHLETITYQDIRGMVENLINLHHKGLKEAPSTEHRCALVIRKLIIIVGELATRFEKIGAAANIDWIGVAGTLATRKEKVCIPNNHTSV